MRGSTAHSRLPAPAGRRPAGLVVSSPFPWLQSVLPCPCHQGIQMEAMRRSPREDRTLLAAMAAFPLQRQQQQSQIYQGTTLCQLRQQHACCVCCCRQSQLHAMARINQGSNVLVQSPAAIVHGTAELQHIILRPHLLDISIRCSCCSHAGASREHACKGVQGAKSTLIQLRAHMSHIRGVMS